MHRSIRSTIAVSWVLAAATVLFAQGAPAAAPADERIAAIERSLAQTREELAALKAASSGAADARVVELERKIDILAAEVETLRIGDAAETTEAADRTGARGLGEAAAKVYGVKRGVSIGGYGEALYENTAGRDQAGNPSGAVDRIDFLRAVAYLGYKFDDRWVLNTEIEYEHALAGDGANGEVAVEFAYLDYMHCGLFNVRSGLVLVPVGLVNELHEPTVSIGARRPDVERYILPTTWRELGAGVYGDSGVLAYRAYVTSSLDAAGFTSGGGFRSGRQKGSEAIAEDWAVSGRLDYVATPGLLVGASMFSGETGQDALAPSGESVDGRTTVLDAHVDWQWRGLWVRGLYAQTTISQAGLINQLNGFVGDESVGNRQNGWYVQAAYDVLSFSPTSKMSLLPYARYEGYDTQRQVPAGYARNPANDRTQLTVGLAFQPIDRLIFKLDWQQRRNAARTGVDAWNVALGYIF